MPSRKSVLYCHCVHARVLPTAVKEAVLRRLCESSISFLAVPDLCGMAARHKPVLKELAASEALQIAACYPRAIQWLFTAGQAPLRAESVQVVNLRVEEAEKASAVLVAPELEPNLLRSPTPDVDGFSKDGKISAREVATDGGTPPKSAGEDACATPRSLQVVVYEGPGTAPLQSEERFQIFMALLGKGYAVSCARHEAEIPSAGGGPMLVLGRFLANPPNGLSFGPGIRVQDISGVEAGRIMEMVEARRTELGAPPPEAWLPWFPVIDYDRCTQCMQCLSFCLFGVFGVEAGQGIAVQQSEQCKTNCPACSRVCPEAAIIFPKHPSGPINGEAINQTALEREKMKIDVSALLGGDIYQMLRARSERAQSRFSKERDSQKALQERQRCLAKLLQGADIPPEVLMALPSAEEIQRKAAEAMAKAQAALRKKG